MHFTLDPYQVEFSYNIRAALAKHNRIIACAATGAGKSKIFIDLAHRAYDKGRTVLIITESKKIFKQITAELSAATIDPKSQHIYLPKGGIYIAMAQTLARRKELIDQLKSQEDDLFIIVDEAHIGTFNQLLQHLNKAMLAGFTATPDARWAHHLPLFYKSIVIGPQPEELIRLGFLCRCRHFARVGADFDQLLIQNGDFTEASQEKAFETSKVFDGLVDDLRKIPYKKCLIFTASVKDCNTVHQQLTNAGFNCSIAHRNSKNFKMSDIQFEYNLGQFIEGNVNICISVGTLTKGFDFPAIDLIVLRRATTSLPLFLQMIGRGSRKRGTIDKDNFTVLDYGANYIRHGLWDAERNWEDFWNRPKKSKDGVAPIKVCPLCEYITSSSATCCPNCGYEFVKKDLPLEYGKLIEITEKYDKMKGKRASQLTAEELSVYARLKNKKNFAARIATARDQEKPGYLEKYAEAMDYKPGWAEWRRKLIKEGEEVSYPDFEIV